MIQSYLVGPPPIPLGYEGVLHQHLSRGEPGFLTMEDILGPTGEECADGRLYLPPPDSVPAEPILWSEALFEPEDVLELWGIAPKGVSERMAPYQFLWNAPRRQYNFCPWITAGELHFSLSD